MVQLKNAQICYLLAYPDTVETKTPAEHVKGLKNAPYFEPVDINVHTLGQEFMKIHDIQVTLLRLRYDDRVALVECRFEIQNVFDDAGIALRQELENTLQQKIVPENFRAKGLFEVYKILLIGDQVGVPDDFIQAHEEALARYIRAEQEILDPTIVKEILTSRIRYSKDDLTLVDWEGAVIFASKSDFQSDIELLKIGNYQLLRYRMLGESIENILRMINEDFKKGRSNLWFPMNGKIRDIVNHRLELMLDFEHNEQNLLFIGDWYTAKLYHIISDEFYLSAWQEAVHTKLDNLESIISTIQENFTLSWRGLLENVQLLGWLLLLAGYFFLFFKELGN